MNSIVVIGCPHSGTKYTSEVLNACGLDVGHEHIQSDGVVSWQHTHWTREQFIDDGVREPLVILHQIRHPIMAISSFSLLSWGVRRWAGNYFVKQGWPWHSEHGLLQWMQLWYYWNILAMTTAEHTYRVEWLREGWHWFSTKVGLTCEYPDVGRTINRHPQREIITWEQMQRCNGHLADDILDLAYKVGYSEDPVSYLHDTYYDFRAKE